MTNFISKKTSLLFVSLFYVVNSLAIDTYNSSTGLLIIDSVKAFGDTYKNVVIKVGKVISVNGGDALGVIDTYDPVKNQLYIQSVQVDKTTYYNVLVEVSSVLSVGSIDTTSKMGAVSSIPITKDIWDKWWKKYNPDISLASNGITFYKVQYTTNSSQLLLKTPVTKWSTLPWDNSFMFSLELSTEQMLRAQAAGMKIIASPFLSDVPQNAGSRSNPKIWEGFTLQQTADAIEKYTYESTTYILSMGVKPAYYDLGNEADTGILDFTLGKNVPFPKDSIFSNLDYMVTNVWIPNSLLFKAAIKGIKRADPSAKFSIQAVGLAVNPNNTFLKKFLSTLVDQGVSFDYFGLTYPYHAGGFGGVKILDTSIPYYKTAEFQSTIAYLAALGKKIIIAEFSYPNRDLGLEPGGAYGGSPETGYPFTPQGQSDWVRDFLNYCNNEPNIYHCSYFYPVFFPGLDQNTLKLESTGLFQSDTAIQPAMINFRN